MRFSVSSVSLSALALLLVRSAAAQAFFTADGPVQLVEAKDFDREVVKIEKPVLAMFFAHWCGHCRTTAPEFLKAARSLDGIVKFAAIDCDATANRDKCAEYDVKGYPTIKLFPATKRRVPRDYPGERKAQAFLDYAVEQLPLSAKKLQAMELKPFLDKNPQRAKVILLSTKATSSPMFRSLALDFRSSHSFAYLRATDDPVHSPIFAAARAHLGISDLKSEKDLPALVLVKPSDSYTFDSVVKYEGKIKYRQVKEWLDAQHDPSASKAAADEKPKAKKPRTPKKAAETKEEKIPEGGTIEWRAQNLDAEKEAARAKLKANAKAASSKLASASATASSAASEASSSAASAAKSASAAAEPIVKKVVDKAQEAVETVGETLVDAANKVADAASAAADTETGAKVSEGIVNAADAVKETLEKGGETVAGLFGASKEKVQEAKEKAKAAKNDDLPFESVEEAILSNNADHLLESLASYLGEVTPGGASAWKEQYGAQVEEARKAAREAILNAPDKAAAAEMALNAEKWLLDAVTFDETKLARGEDSGEDEFEGQMKLTIEQKRKLNEMGKTLRKRIAAREAKLKEKKEAEAAAGKKSEEARSHDEL
ncbi:hypothetical protein OC834_000619 [Tilletia horrida]|nr:hypothetical protein OC834_000619 [Tilletia horrida]KAK0560735.1 hypothetical protein OC844_003586 [Tilletia horrida]